MSASDGAAHPPVSVLIATYNRDESLCAAISSVLAQDYPGDVQLIVVDQSPTHGEEAAGFLRRHEKQMRHLQLAEPNLPKARNVGLAEARGELIVFVDDDVILPPEVLSRLASRFQGERFRALSGLVVSKKNPEDSLRSYVQQCGSGVLDPSHGPIEVQYLNGCLICVSTEAARLVKGFDETFGKLTPTAYGEDHDFCDRLRKAGVRLFIDPSLRILHLDHVAGGCQSRTIDPELGARYHARTMAYLSLKRHGRLGLRDWAWILRGMVLNRGSLKMGLGHVLNRFRLVRRGAAEAREAFGRLNQ